MLPTRGKFIAVQSYLKKQEKKKSNRKRHLTSKATRERRRRRRTTKMYKVSRRKKILKIRAEVNEIEMMKTIVNINEIKNWFFEKINKLDKPLARLIKEKKGED